MRYRASDKKFRAVSKKYTLSFRYEAQAYYACKRGFAKRTQILGNTYFLPLIDFQPGDLVVDCGANVGELKYYFIENDIPIEYIGVEPAPLEFECMKENVAPSQAMNLGLWNEEGELDFYLSGQTADSSLIEPPSYDAVIKVPIRRLDSLLPDKQIKLLKLEAEGAEPEAIYGCEKILGKIEYISADVGWERGVEQSNTMSAVTNFLLGNGFELIEVGHKRLTALYRNRSFA